MIQQSRPNRALFVCACIFFFASSTGAMAPLGGPIATPSASTLPVIEPPDPATLELARVVRILDGDTLLIKAGGKTRRYQLLGADAPEFIPKARTPDPLAIQSRRFIEQLLLNEQVYIQHDPLAQRDSANRLTAYIFRAPDMLFVNLELVRQGYAKYDTKNMSIYQEAFATYESRAQDLHRGIWNPNPEPPPLLDRVPESDPTIGPTTPAAAPDKPASTNDNQSVVFVTKYGKKYHKKDCPHLTDTQHQVDREDLDDSYQPCKTCKPDE